MKTPDLNFFYQTGNSYLVRHRDSDSLFEVDINSEIFTIFKNNIRFNVKKIINRFSNTCQKQVFDIIQAEPFPNQIIEKNGKKLKFIEDVSLFNTPVKLGFGSYASVYLVKDENDNEYALKLSLVKKEGLKEQNIYENIKNCSSIIQPIDIFCDENKDGFHYILMPVLKEELSKLNINEKPYSIEELTGIFKKLLISLKQIHEKGVIHCDIKKENIMIDKDGNPYFIDFGISGFIGEKTDKIVSWYFRPPELLDEDTEYEKTPEVDIWALGCTFLYVLSGTVPFVKYGIFYDIKGHVYEKDLYNAIFDEHCNCGGIPEMISRLFKYKIIPFYNSENLAYFQVLQNTITNMICINPDDRYKPDELIKILDSTDNIIINEEFLLEFQKNKIRTLWDFMHFFPT